MSKSDIHNTLQIIAESIPGNVTIIKPDGSIFCVNQDWIDFASNIGMPDIENWNTYNYFDICEKVHGEDKTVTESVFQGIQNLLEQVLTSLFLEYPCHSPIEKRWFELRAKLIEIEGRTFVCLMHFNVTEKVKAQKKLAENQKLYSIVSENAPFGIALIQGNISQYANARLLTYLEYNNLQQYINTPFWDNVHPEDKPIVEQKIKRIQEKRAYFPFNVKARFITTSGKIKFFSIDIYLVSLNNKKLKLLNVIDESEKITTERSEKQLVIDAMYLNRKQEILESFSQFIEGIKDKYEFQDDDLKQFTQIKNQFKFQANDWNLMKTHFQLIHKDFFLTLSERFPLLTQLDLNFCAMLKLNFSTKEIARYLNIKDSSVKRRKVRLKKKLNLSEEDKLIAYIQSI